VSGGPDETILQVVEAADAGPGSSSAIFTVPGGYLCRLRVVRFDSAVQTNVDGLPSCGFVFAGPPTLNTAYIWPAGSSQAQMNKLTTYLTHETLALGGQPQWRYNDDFTVISACANLPDVWMLPEFEIGVAGPAAGSGAGVTFVSALIELVAVAGVGGAGSSGGGPPVPLGRLPFLLPTK
jgi:hypothetical protein